VVLGLDDPAEPARVAAEARLVQAYDRDPARVAAARVAIRRLGLADRVHADLLDEPVLPFAEGVVNLLVARDDLGVGREECRRVLAPGGSIGGAAPSFTAPRPAGMDAWTHYLHDASGNPVGQDALVGPPRHLRWIDHPYAYRSHTWNQSFRAMVSDGQRVFTIQDEGPIGVLDDRFPEQWSLFCRDAHNGTVLWKAPMRTWGWRSWEDLGPTNGPAYRPAGATKGLAPAVAQQSNMLGMWGSPLSLPRRLVAGAGEVYATLDYRGGVEVLDAATGRVRRSIATPAPVDEILLPDSGTLVLALRELPERTQVLGTGDAPAFRQLLASERGRAWVAAYDVATGRERWKTPVPAIAPVTLAALGGRVCGFDYEAVFCLDLATGRQVWRTATTPIENPKAPGTFVKRGAGVLSLHDDLVLFAGKGFCCLDAASGRVLWEDARASAKQMFGDFNGFFVADGLLWLDATQGRDLRTGAVRRTLDLGNMLKRGHHVRCYRFKATEQYLIWGQRGAEFIDLDGDDHAAPDWLRSGCGLGVMPANGLLYATPDPCQCYKGVKLPGFKAIAGHRGPVREPAQRLETGPAAGRPLVAGTADAADWPMYRRDPARLAAAPQAVAAQPTPAWSRRVGDGRLTPPVIADGRVYAAVIDERRLVCLDAGDGRVLWEHVAGGRIDLPPTIAGGRVYVGARDGTVTCLDAADGAMAWRFLAAPERRLIQAYGGLESTWPVHGSVLVEGGLVYASAGRNTYLDGGLRLFALDAISGAVRHQTVVAGPAPSREELRAGVDARYVSGIVLDGSNNDILVSDGGTLSLLFQRFQPDLTPLPTAVAGKMGQRDLGSPRLMATGGFANATIFGREFWSYSRYWWFPDYTRLGNLIAVDGDRLYSALLFGDGGSTGHKMYLWMSGSGQTHLRVSSTAEAADPMAMDEPKHTGKPLAEARLPVIARALIKAGDRLVLAGPASGLRTEDPLAPFEDRGPARLLVCSATDLAVLGQAELPAVPVFDGLASAQGALVVGLVDGTVVCMRGP
jgi:outer membrane protein assembly factor BamB